MKKETIKSLKNIPFEFGIKPPYPKIVSTLDTLKKIYAGKNSIARYGDGEFNIIFGGSIRFQEYDEELAKQLTKILTSSNDKLLVGIPNIFRKLNRWRKKSQSFWRNYLYDNRRLIYDKLVFEKVYYDSFITRPYEKLTGVSDYAEEVFKWWNKIFSNRKIVVIEGDSNSILEEKFLLDESDILDRIIGPDLNAFGSIDTIYKKVCRFPNDCLILIRLGPTATVLANWLCIDGYQALDIGHLNREYKAFLDQRKTK